ncbi:MAG: glycosyltransferase family 2 protein [Mariniphaga sp.]
MSFTDLLTIAMPCYERKEFFLEALESALNQTIKCKVIVVDNCSSHNYYEKVCEEKGVTYYRNQTNIGLYPNINRCFELSETEYVKILDDDDILSPLYVESFLKAKNSHPDIDIFFSDFALVSSKGKTEHRHVLPFGYMEKGHRIIEYGIRYRLGFPFMASTLKKYIYQKKLGEKDLIGSHDWEWIYSTADQFSFYGDPQKLYNYRIHDNQNTKTEKSLLELSVPYIYDKILFKKTTNPELKKKASKNALNALIVFKTGIKRNQLLKILKDNNKYSKYLRIKMNESIMVRFILLLPRNTVKILNKVYKKISLSN